MQTKFNFKGNSKNALNKLILVCVHGDEICGFKAFEQLNNEGFFRNIKDNLTIILANPKACLQNKRFIDINLNRVINEKEFCKKKYYEHFQASIIAKEILKSDQVLDIHSTSSATPAYALVSKQKESLEIAKKLPVKYIIHGLAHTTSGKSTTSDFALKNKIPLIVTECGQHTSTKTIHNAKKIIKAFINQNKSYKQQEMNCTKNEKVKKDFKFIKKFKAFEKVDFKQEIAINNGKTIECPYKNGAYIIMPTAKPIINEEAWFWGKPK